MTVHSIVLYNMVSIWYYWVSPIWSDLLRFGQIWSDLVIRVTLIQRLDYNVSRYFVCIKCTARHKFLAGLDGHCKKYRATGPHRATGPQGRSRRGRDSTHRRTSPPIWRPCVTAVRSEVNRDTQGHLQNTQIYRPPSRCAVCRTGPPDYQLWFMTCIREEEDTDYLQACPTGPPVDGVKSALTPGLCGPVALYLLQ